MSQRALICNEIVYRSTSKWLDSWRNDPRLKCHKLHDIEQHPASLDLLATREMQVQDRIADT
eukprot:467013-Pleurochrysis_carterae.AAC.1